VDFLTNPRVQKSSLLQKRNFLVSKGLNDDEIQLAFEKAGIFTKVSDLDKNESETRIQITSTASSSGLQKVSFFERFKSLAGSFALVSGIVYGVYLFYKVRDHFSFQASENKFYLCVMLI
jgi:peroxin-14